MNEDKKTALKDESGQCQAEACKEDLMNGLLAILAEEEEKASKE